MAKNTEANRRYYLKHREKELARCRANHEAAPEKRRARRYKVSLERMRELLAIPNCECCGRTLTAEKRLSRHIDHCHTSNKVRGAICADCNALLGYANDDVTRLQAAIAYLEKHK